MIDMMKYFCDICDKQISVPEHVYFLRISIYPTQGIPTGTKVPHVHETCALNFIKQAKANKLAIRWDDET